MTMILDDPSISSIVFYPQKIKVPRRLPKDVEILQFKISEDVTLGGLYFLKDKALPTMLLFHGNGEICTDYADGAEDYMGCGVNLAVMDFRGYGFSTGTPFYSCLFSDALPVYEHLRKWIQEKAFNDSIFIFGRSLGSACAAEVGSKDPEGLKGVIFESGFANTYRLMTRLFHIDGEFLPKDMIKEWSNDTRINKFTKPVLIIHGTEDFIVHSEQAQMIYDAVPDVYKKKVMIMHAGHNDIFFFKDEYLPEIKNFIDEFK